MIIFVKTLAGKSFQLNVNTDDSIKTVKEALHDLDGYETSAHELIYSAKILADDQYLNECNIIDGSSIFLALKENGCQMLNRVVKVHVKTLIGKISGFF